MPKTVLLADDSITIQHAVGISLANEDIALINVNNGEDAIIKARAMRPDLMLLDVVMPRLSGYDVCKQVRADPSIKHTPVIMLVGAIEGFDENKFKDAMANDYIIKPFESGALINKIRKYLYPELSRSVASLQSRDQSEPKPVTPAAAIPNIPIPPVAPQGEKRHENAPPISIPPKPATPPVVPPVIPPTDPHRFTVPPIPPMPPHIPATEEGHLNKKSPATEEIIKTTSFIDNLITPPDLKPQVPAQEMVDEISPQEIEEITSEIPDMREKDTAVNPPVAIDIVSQVVESVEKNEQVAPPQVGTDKEATTQFDIDNWGVELKNEITAETKAPPLEQPAIPDEKIEGVEESQVDLTSQPIEQPMEVVTIAEGISTEQVGPPVKPVEVPQEPIAPVQVEPTSLVEPTINLSGTLNEGTIKYIRETVERVVWEIVPELAEKLIKAEIKRLMSEKEE